MWSFYTAGNRAIRTERKIVARQAKTNQYRIGTKKHDKRAKLSGRRINGTTVKTRRKV